jgi:hypothetical protein
VYLPSHSESRAYVGNLIKRGLGIIKTSGSLVLVSVIGEYGCAAVASSFIAKHDSSDPFVDRARLLVGENS